MKAVFDTSILVDYLRGLSQASQELDRYQSPAISVITWIEVIAGTTTETEAKIRAFLQTFEILNLDQKTSERAAQIRKTRRIKLPDAIIWATAQINQCLLVTRNSRDMDPDDPSVRVPYQI